MLSKDTLAHLSTLTYRADAKRQVCIVPLGSIYWDDEMPDIHRFVIFPEPDRTQVLRLFTIRLRIWDHQTLSEDDRQFWESVRSRAPDWALFRRLDLSEDDQREREEAERACAKEFEEFLADADQVTISEEKHGMQSFAATFHLNKDQPVNAGSGWWWGRIYRRLKQFGTRSRAS
jgi:hypothetical protein